MFIGYYNIANFVTLLGLVSALCSCVASFNGDYRLAVIFLIICVVSDTIDGRIARSLKRNEKQKTFGVQIDTVCDMVSFGVAPAVLGYCFGLRGWWVLVLFVFIVCGAIRLAYFNTLEIHGEQPKGYKGMPIPTSSVFIPSVMWLKLYLPQNLFLAVFAFAFLLLAFLYILNIDVIKPKGKLFILLPIVQLAVLAVYILYGEALS